MRIALILARFHPMDDGTEEFGLMRGEFRNVLGCVGIDYATVLATLGAE